MSEITPETNTLKPDAQEASQNLPTTTPDAESSPSSLPVIQEPPAATTPPNHTTDSEARPAVTDPKVDAVFISDSEPVITERERAPEQVILTEQLSSSSPATSIVALEQPSATPADPGQSSLPTSEPETIQVEPVTILEATPKPAPNPQDSVLTPPENPVEPTMSSTAGPQPTTTGQNPTEATTVPAVTATTTAQPTPSPATDAKLAEVPSKNQENEKTEASVEPENKLTKKFTEGEWRALKEFRVSILLPNTS